MMDVIRWEPVYAPPAQDCPCMPTRHDWLYEDAFADCHIRVCLTCGRVEESRVPLALYN